jgi:hypothetical protein
MRRILWTVGLGAMLLVGCAVESSPPSSQDSTTAPQDESVTSEATERSPLHLPANFTPATFPIGPESCSESCPGEACCFAGQHVGWLCC